MKKKRKLNLGKSKIANINTMYRIKGGMTVGCASDTCPAETQIETCTSYEGNYTCPTTHTVPASQTCPGGTMGESGNGGGGATNDTCSANLPSLNC